MENISLLTPINYYMNSMMELQIFYSYFGNVKPITSQSPLSPATAAGGLNQQQLQKVQSNKHSDPVSSTPNCTESRSNARPASDKRGLTSPGAARAAAAMGSARVASERPGAPRALFFCPFALSFKKETIFLVSNVKKQGI